MAFGRFLLGSHNVMVMALGSCVKWPYTFTIFIYLFLVWFVTPKHIGQSMSKEYYPQMCTNNDWNLYFSCICNTKSSDYNLKHSKFISISTG